MVNSDNLSRAGRALYGPNWKNQLARELGINPVRLRDWLKEKREIPPGIWQSVIDLLKKRKIDIDAVLSDIE